MIKYIILYSTLLLKLISAFPQPTETYTYGTVLRDPDIYRVFWKEDGHKITFELHVKNKGGWIGFGLSPNGGMKGSDIFTGKLENGKPVFHDRYATGKSMPIIDKLQDWEVILAKEVGDHVIFKICRKLQTCDPDQDREILAGTTRLIWAYGSITGGSDYLTKHSDVTKRGTKSVQLLAGESPEPEKLPDGLEKLDFKVQNFTLPANKDTFYRCEIIKLPKFPSKRHVIAFEPIFDAEHPETLHHIFMFGCNSHLNINDSHTGSAYECYTDQVNMGTSRDSCNIVMMAWGVGGKRYIYSDDIGFPIGRDEDPSYIRFEIHYDNPGKRNDIVDNSGFRLWYTDKLRKYDTNILELGHPVTPYQIIPPQTEKFTTFGKCPSECLEEAFDEANLEEVTVTSAILHAHIKGVQIILRVFRGDKELEPLLEEKTYDFNYQDFTNLPKARKLRKGDRLTVECVYNTVGEDSVVLGGLSTRQEMCLAFVGYYPALPISKCVGEPIHSKTAPIYANLNNINWKENNNVEKQQIIAKSEEVKIYCDNGKILYKSDRKEFKISNDYIPYTKPNLCDGFPMPSEKYPFSAILKEPNLYKVYWKVVNDMITFEIQVKTKGWVGFGISPNGGMTKSDVIMAWMKNGKVYLEDRFAKGNSEPILDKKQDWKIKWGKIYHDYSIYNFERKLRTCDEEHDIDINVGTTRLIWSYSTEIMNDRDKLVGHTPTTRGTKSVQLLNSKPPMDEDKKLIDSKPVDFKIGNFSLPSEKRTYYRCEMFKFPNFTKKHHIIAAEPIIDTRHPSLLHHIFIYGCNRGHPINDEHVGQGYECYSRETNMASTFDKCSIVFMAWAVGGTRFFFPDEVGLPIGGDNDPLYFRMEVHYDNPSFQKDVVDTSGLRFWVTDKLRKNDMKILEVGHKVTRNQIIPPNTPDFLSIGTCSENCLEKAFEEAGKEEVTIFLALLHAHLKGVQMKLRHFRDGIELEPISHEKHYDFNFQEYSLLAKTRKLRKTDRLVVECTYDSSKDNKPTYGGLRTDDEMCLSYIGHYPALPLSKCHSVPANTTYALKDETFDWSDKTVINDLKKIAKSNIVNLNCNNGITKYLTEDESKNIVLKPYKKEYKVKNPCDIKGPGPDPDPNSTSKAIINAFLLSIIYIYYVFEFANY